MGMNLSPHLRRRQNPRMTRIVSIARDVLEDRLAYTEGGRLFSTARTTRCNIVESRHDLDIAPQTSRRSHRSPAMTLRWTVATELIGMGIGLDLVADILGHEDGTRHHRSPDEALRARRRDGAQTKALPGVGREARRAF